MKSGWKSKFTAASALGLMLIAPAALGQTSDYPGDTTVRVEGELIERRASAEIGDAVNQSVQPVVDASRAAKVAGTGGGLAVTGGDIAGLVVLGIGALGTGTVLVRRSRSRDA